MAVKKMGFEGKLYYGSAGSTATNELTNTRDINYNLDTEKGDTTTRGAGTSPPKKTERVTALGITIEFTMLNKTDDTYLEALKVAAYAGTPVALRTKDYSSGKGFDGDCILDVQHGKPLNGEQTLQFTATPNDDSRDPSLYV
jgi:hypothetical protein